MATIKPQLKFQSPEIFLFPLSSQGLETVSSVFQLMNILQKKFKKAYKNRPEIKCQYQYSFPRFYSYVQGLQYIKLVAHCKFCSHQLVYFKNLSFEHQYKLMAFRKYHVHTKDKKKMREVYISTFKDVPRCYRYQPQYIRMLKFNDTQKQTLTPYEYLKSLPPDLRMKTKLRLLIDRYQIAQDQFNSLVRKIDESYQVPLRQLFQQFEDNNTQYSFLPKNILQVQDQYLRNKKSLYYALKEGEPIQQVVEHEQFYQKSIYFVDKQNPNKPNILLIITQKMKELYLQYGQYVGFDLTFSIIRERPTHHKQYLMGMLGGSTESRRTVIYGLVITNNQSVEAYHYIFTEFLKIMGKSPTAILTDEQKAIYYALKQVKQQGLFKGNHLFDMFHILKKFRKSTDGQCFQLYRKILHVTNRAEYRFLFRSLMKDISSDKELEVLRIFDANSQKYCFSQIPAMFVGANISNGINQNFHSMLKAQMPFQTKYIKAVKIMQQVANQIISPKQPDIEVQPIEQMINLPNLKQYRTLFARFTFKLIVRQVARAGRHYLLSRNQQKQGNLLYQKREDSRSRPRNVTNLLVKEVYYVQTKYGPYKVYKTREKHEQLIMNDKKSNNLGKWRCLCQFEQKTGIICSHLAKVLIYLGQDFMDNMHPRWLIKQNSITKRLLDYKHVSKFLKLRARHKVRVRLNKNTLRMLDEGHFASEQEQNKKPTEIQEASKQKQSEKVNENGKAKGRNLTITKAVDIQYEAEGLQYLLGLNQQQDFYSESTHSCITRNGLSESSIFEQQEQVIDNLTKKQWLIDNKYEII